MTLNNNLKLVYYASRRSLLKPKCTLFWPQHRNITSLANKDPKTEDIKKKLKPFTFEIPMFTFYERVALFGARCLTYGWVWAGLLSLCLISYGCISTYAKYDEKGKYDL